MNAERSIPHPRVSLGLGAVLTAVISMTLALAGCAEEPLPGAVQSPPTELSPAAATATQTDTAAGRLEQSMDPVSKLELEGRDRAAAETRAFRAGFIASGKDIHSLPDVFISTQNIDDGSLANALSRSSVVILGTVVDQSAEMDGYVASTIRIDTSIDGEIATDTAVVIQTGGPVLSSHGPALAELPQSPILRPGHQYLLFGWPAAQRTGGKYAAPLAIGGAGNIYEVNGGRLDALGTPDEMNAELDGLTLTDAESRIGVALAASPNRASP